MLHELSRDLESGDLSSNAGALLLLAEIDLSPGESKPFRVMRAVGLSSEEMLNGARGALGVPTGDLYR